MILRLRYAIFLSLITAGCNSAPVKSLAVHPCAILPGITSCYAVHLNDSSRPEYERILAPGDIVFTPDEYMTIQKYTRDLQLKTRECK